MDGYTPGSLYLWGSAGTIFLPSSKWVKAKQSDRADRRFVKGDIFLGPNKIIWYVFLADHCYSE